jgi:hypothetical protein
VSWCPCCPPWGTSPKQDTLLSKCRTAWMLAPKARKEEAPTKANRGQFRGCPLDTKTIIPISRAKKNPGREAGLGSGEIGCAISFSNLYGFLLLLASLLTSRQKQSQLAKVSEYDYAVAHIKDQMLETLWNAHKDDFPSLEIEISGTPDRYFLIEQRQREGADDSGRAQAGQ